MNTRFPTLLLLIVLCLPLGCKSARPTSEAPRGVATGYTITVAPFTQPVTTSQLITGIIPEHQGRIPVDMLASLDIKLRELLAGDQKHRYSFAWPTRQHPLQDITRFHNSEQPQALPLWVAYGKKLGADALLIPQVIDWRERQGSSAGVTESAQVRVEFFLLKVSDATIVNRSIFEEKQMGLADNLLTVGNFLKRHGTWVTASELAADGMAKAIKDMNL
ncbi:MAG: conserved hypothetical protein [Candidatus Desulfovibrio kirbyi]|uniref:Lipoprotein n=1 Tax=Candidatus Desulfovibrio kirbyi TaxID=2696086 RepID=A0A6L2R5F9_9BACT|nr:MAG: conserved hypothetical protein [Candidatus Desulfovibrio kirbyi]